MTITEPLRSLPSHRPASSWRHGALGLLLTAVAGGAMTYLALHNAPGVISHSDINVDTDFTNDNWVTASLLLVVPIFLTARVSGWFGSAAALVAGFLQFVIADVTVERFVDSGWSDGLEGLAYVYALFVAMIFAAAALVGWFTTRRKRRAVAR